MLARKRGHSHFFARTFFAQTSLNEIRDLLTSMAGKDFRERKEKGKFYGCMLDISIKWVSGSVC